MIQAKPSEPHRVKSRNPPTKEQDPALLISCAARAFERCGERFRILARLAHGQESSRWSRMARAVERAAELLRSGSARYEELRQEPAKGLIR